MHASVQIQLQSNVQVAFGLETCYFISVKFISPSLWTWNMEWSSDRISHTSLVMLLPQPSRALGLWYLPPCTAGKTQLADTQYLLTTCVPLKDIFLRGHLIQKYIRRLNYVNQNIHKYY